MSITLGILASSRSATAALLLDTYPGANVAYSLRKLRTAYTGAAIRVRRSSDNTETDIGFVANVLDTSALTTFVGANNGFITIWYDQSGNGNNLAQTTALNQPIIVNSGSLITRNSKPYFQASATQFLQFSTDLASTTYSYWMNYEKNATGNQAILLFNISSYHWLDYGLSQQVTSGNAITISSIYAINTLYLNNTIIAGATGSIYRSNILIGTGSISTSSSSRFLPSNSFRTATITLAEFVLYNSDKSANRTEITNNINSYYSIF
jgi:hypothetical protein